MIFGTGEPTPATIYNLWNYLLKLLLLGVFLLVANINVQIDKILLSVDKLTNWWKKIDKCIIYKLYHDKLNVISFQIYFA